jgi:hypothetical protein
VLALAGVNAIAVLLFSGAYVAAGAQLLSQGAFLAALVVLFVAATALWIRTEQHGARGRDVVGRIGRIAVGLVIAAIAVPGLALMPLFALQQQLPEEAGVAGVIPGVMVILLASLVLVALVNVAGIAYLTGSAVVRRLRAR